MANVKFYRLSTLPSFIPSSHVGVFIHITADYTPANTVVRGYEGGQGYNPSDSTTWGTASNFDGTFVVKKGLWFGGYQSWEFLTNDTDSSAIVNAIDDLDAATVATLTQNTDEYGNITLTLKGVQENNGIISQGDGTGTVTIGNGALTISGENGNGTATNATLTTANASTNNNLELDPYALTFTSSSTPGTAGKISVLTQTAVSITNKIATMADIANIAGAMHYKGRIENLADWPTGTGSRTVNAGDTYIASSNFTYTLGGANIPIELGDMVVFEGGSTSSFHVFQSNMTVGVADGQIAKNDGALTNGNLVVATARGIATTNIDSTAPASRTLTVASGTADGQGFYHDATATDDLDIFGVDYTKILKISSDNTSIEVKKGTGNDEVAIDLIWQTAI